MQDAEVQNQVDDKPEAPSNEEPKAQTFSQDDLNKVVGERLARERAKYEAEVNRLKQEIASSSTRASMSDALLTVANDVSDLSLARLAVSNNADRYIKEGAIDKESLFADYPALVKQAGTIEVNAPKKTPTKVAKDNGDNKGDINNNILKATGRL